jgi:hypothetical protein
MENKNNLIQVIQDRLNAVNVDIRKKVLLIFVAFFLIVFAIRFINSINNLNSSSDTNDTININKQSELSSEDSSKMKVLELELQQYKIDENLDKLIDDLVEKDRKSLETNKKTNE